MTLFSFHFVIYFFILLIILSLIKSSRIQIGLMLLFSYLIIAKVDIRFFLCLLMVTLFTYTMAFHVKKHLSWGVIGLVLVLGYFKYTNFFIESLNTIFHANWNTIHIILPLGISFYIFSAISYLVDVYRNKIPAEKNLLDFALYIAFFPKLTAGPIVRYRDFMNQIKHYKGIHWLQFAQGIQIFVFGMFKKMVLADHLAIFVNDVYYAPSAYNTGTVLLAIVSYSFQIYFDFSGYSDMAIGLSKILGFDLKANFNLPYVANGFSDFWKRWHISLSSWFMEYVYIPLGGSRVSNARTYGNLLVTMLLSGLWHGAGMTFIVWGFFHGVCSCLERALKKKSRLLTFVVVSILWVFFRAESISHALAILQSALTIHGGISQPYVWSFFAIGCYLIALVAVVLKNKNMKFEGFVPVLDLTKISSLVIFFVFVGLTLLLGYYGNTVFIYGNF